MGGSEDEDETHGEVESENVTRLDGFDCHETTSEEAVESIEALGGGEDVGLRCVSEVFLGRVWGTHRIEQRSFQPPHKS